MSRSKRAGLVVAVAGFAMFAGVRWPLVRGDGALTGLTVDSSILALMGKKMLEGRGFDVFAWGVRHLGPLTSAIAAAWAALLLAAGAVWPWPLAVRLAAMTQVAIGIALLAWTTARIDRRAAALLVFALAIGPPELFNMSVYPLGHEMAFLLSAVVLALAAQHVTAAPGRGWLSTIGGQLAIGFAAGLGWWMNKTMAPAIVAVLVVLTLRSELFATLRPHLRFKDRLLLRVSPPLPGVLEAALFVLYWSGVALLAMNVAGDLLRIGRIPFVFGWWLDGLILIGVAQAVLLIARPSRFPRLPLRELRGLAMSAAAFALGVAPAVTANLLDWYPRSYVAAMDAQPAPTSIINDVRLRSAEVAHLFLGPAPAAGILLAIVLVLVIHHRHAMAAFLSLTPRAWGVRALFACALGITLASSLLLSNAFHSRYLLAAAGPLFALVALELLRWWDRERAAARVLAVLAGGLVFITLTNSALDARVRPAADPRRVLRQVDALGCRVTYTGYFQAYVYRLLSDERSAWIPYMGNVDQTPQDTAAARALPGRRCYLTEDGLVFPIPGDLPLRGKGRPIPTPPAGFIRPARPSV
jgi:hypothetical protein